MSDQKHNPCEWSGDLAASERCEICERRKATLFMVVRQDTATGGERVAKAHVCLVCFEEAQEQPVVVEEVSLQEWKETVETWELNKR